MVRLALSELIEQDLDPLREDLPVQHAFDQLALGDIVHDLIQVRGKGAASEVDDHIAKPGHGQIVDVLQRHGHHFAAGQDHGHGDGDLILCNHLTAREFIVIYDLCVHGLGFLQAFHNNFKNQRVERESQRFDFILIELVDIRDVRLIVERDVRDLLPGFRGHLCHHFSLNRQVFGFVRHKNLRFRMDFTDTVYQKSGFL